MPRPVYGEAERFLADQVKRSVRLLGRVWYRPGIFVDDLAAYRKDIGFLHDEVHGDRDLLKTTVLDRVRDAIREADIELRERNADPRYGYAVSPTMALKGQEGWDETMAHYAVCLMWRGPKPQFWPHKVTLEDVQAAKHDDDDGYDRDYRDLVGISPTDWFKQHKREREGQRNGSH